MKVVLRIRFTNSLSATDHISDLDIPVSLVTGDPSIKTASTAVELGAFRYLIKPVQARELTDCIRRALRMYKMAKLRRQALELMGNNRMLPTGDRKSLEIYFSRALETMWIAFQPIIIYQDKKVYAYEALVRTEEPSLKFPTAFLVAAERLNRLQDMSRLIRKKVAERMVHAPEHFRFFINLHSLDLNDEDLYSPNAPLSLVAKRIVLEITERASLDEVVGLSEKVKKLRAMGFQIAVDDLGAGYAGLSSFTQLDPEIIKLDMSLIHGIDREFKKQSVVRSMSQLSKQLGMIMIAEGVETERERDVLISLGCDLLQGFLFARPGKGFPTAIF